MTVLPDTRHIAEIIAKLTKLSSSNTEPPQFFANFLQLMIQATGSQGGAIWVLQPEKGPQCYCHLNIELCKLDVPSQQELFSHAVQKTVEEGKTMVIPPIIGDSDAGVTNTCGHCLVFKPLRAGGKVAMIFQLICSQELSQEHYRSVVGIVDQGCETAETYLAHRRAVVLDDDRKSLSKLLNYCEKVHLTLEPEKVVYQVVNLGRETIGCERLVVWVDPKVKRNLHAVSGVDKPDKRAVLMQAIEKLSRYCLREKKPVIGGRKQLVEMPDGDELTDLMKNYFTISQLDQVYLYPMHIEERYLGVLVAEGFSDAVNNLEGVVTSVAGHGAVALNNALEIAEMPVVKPLARFRKIKDDPKRKQKLMFRASIALVAIILCLFLPWNVNIKGDCTLTPQVMRTLVCPIDNGKVKEVVKKDGFVSAGDVIIQLDDFDFTIESRGLQLALEKEKVNFRRGSLTPVEKEQSELEIRRINNELQLKNDMIARCKVKSPIDGTILTPLLDRKVGDSLQRGEQICDLADLNSWQLVISVPQEEIDWVRQAVEGQENETLVPVEFVLEAFPQERLYTEITAPDQVAHSAETLKDGNVFEVRINLAPEKLEDVKRGLRDGMEGSAKIITVKRPLGYVLIRKVLRFFRITFF